eukprot:scaffold2146_cov425-Prasinococcus_capsulatus_cf.AAC.5
MLLLRRAAVGRGRGVREHRPGRARPGLRARSGAPRAGRLEHARAAGRHRHAAPLRSRARPALPRRRPRRAQPPAVRAPPRTTARALPPAGSSSSSSDGDARIVHVSARVDAALPASNPWARRCARMTFGGCGPGPAQGPAGRHRHARGEDHARAAAAAHGARPAAAAAARVTIGGLAARGASTRTLRALHTWTEPRHHHDGDRAGGPLHPWGQRSLARALSLSHSSPPRAGLALARWGIDAEYLAPRRAPPARTAQPLPPPSPPPPQRQQVEKGATVAARGWPRRIPRSAPASIGLASRRWRRGWRWGGGCAASWGRWPSST